jgi:hypothetical protein
LRENRVLFHQPNNSVNKAQYCAGRPTISEIGELSTSLFPDSGPVKRITWRGQERTFDQCIIRSERCKPLPHVDAPAPSPEGIVKRIDNIDGGPVDFAENGQTSLGLLWDFFRDTFNYVFRFELMPWQRCFPDGNPPIIRDWMIQRYSQMVM